MAFSLVPKGWAACDGQFLPIAQNQALFALLGTTFGGNGQTSFALPNFQGRVPIHQGDGWVMGEAGGQESHTLIMSELPAHTHLVQASPDNGATVLPAGAAFGGAAGLYGAPTNPTAIHPQTITNVGGSQPHENLQPYLVLNFCIAIQGVFPSQN